MGTRTIKFRFDPGLRKVTADDVVRALKSMLGATGDLSDWNIRRMRLESPLTVEATCQADIYKPFATFVRRMRGVSKGRKPRGDFRGVQAKILDSVDFITRGAFSAVEIAPAGSAAILLNRDAVEHARKVTGQLQPNLIVLRREQMGQLRGYLEQITARKGQLPRFGIRDRVSSHLILCIIPEGSADLLKAAADALTKRVAVTGLIHYGDQSQPTSIKAALIEPIEERVIPFSQLPRVQLTEDGDAAAHVRRLRDG